MGFHICPQALSFETRRISQYRRSAIGWLVRRFHSLLLFPASLLLVLLLCRDACLYWFGFHFSGHLAQEICIGLGPRKHDHTGSPRGRSWLRPTMTRAHRLFYTKWWSSSSRGVFGYEYGILEKLRGKLQTTEKHSCTVCPPVNAFISR